MRLMGIGETVENQADMLLCPALEIDGVSDAQDGIGADVLVTNPLPGSPHILTMDYLLHRAPCVLLMRQERLHLRLPMGTSAMLRPSFAFHRVRLVGGAFAIDVEVGGVVMNLVVDTGASTTLSLSSTSWGRMRTCSAASPRSVVQVGVNGERVCSNVVEARVRVGAVDLGSVDVLANAMPVQGADGYLGMGVLRALDLWIEHGRLGVRRSGLAPRRITSAAARSCEGVAPPACAQAR